VSLGHTILDGGSGLSPAFSASGDERQNCGQAGKQGQRRRLGHCYKLERVAVDLEGAGISPAQIRVAEVTRKHNGIAPSDQIESSDGRAAVKIKNESSDERKDSANYQRVRGIGTSELEGPCTAAGGAV